MKRFSPLTILLILLAAPAFALTMYQIQGQMLDQQGAPVKVRTKITGTMVDAQKRPADCLLASGERIFPKPVSVFTNLTGNMTISLLATSQCTAPRHPAAV